jgi:hypothetical protein
MDWVITLLLVVLAGLNGWLILMTYKILAFLAEPCRGSLHAHVGMTNYSTWMYKDGAWELIDRKLEPGFEPGQPPRRPGAYENEIVRRPAVRKSQ